MKPIKINSLDKETKFLKESVQQYLDKQLYELASESKLQEIRTKRQECLYILDTYGIGYLFDIKRPKTQFEWECLQDILNLLLKFDCWTENVDYVDDTQKRFIYKREDSLRRKLGDIYDPKYNKEII